MHVYTSTPLSANSQFKTVDMNLNDHVKVYIYVLVCIFKIVI